MWTVTFINSTPGKDINSQPSRWWLSGKSLGPRGLLPLWSQVRALRLLIWWPLEAYMVVNFRARGISRGARKLARTPTLNFKKKKRKKKDINSLEGDSCQISTNNCEANILVLTITCMFATSWLVRVTQRLWSKVWNSMNTL
jgi:hypothetical protein